MRIWQGVCLSAVLLGSFVPRCHAQSSVTPEQEYKKLIRVNEDIQPLGANPFGEQVSLYNGSLSFEQTDISLPGNGPLLQLSRSFHTIETRPDDPTGGLSSDSIDGAFSDWDIDIPRISTLVGYHGAPPVWTVDNAGYPYARCNHFNAPKTIPGWQGNADWEPATWWSGYQLIVPGAGSQDLLNRDAGNTVAPSAGVAAYPIVTTQNWQISCGVSTDDETNGGEGFTAVAPDGTVYTLNHLIYRWASTLDRAAGAGPESLQAGEASQTTQTSQSIGVTPMLATQDYLLRAKADMLVTQIRDRFGNTLTYHYDGTDPSRLTSITGSDGRLLTLAHADNSQRITSATLTSGTTSRVWTYTYDETTGSFHRLQSLTLPDGKQWTFNLGLMFADMTPNVPGNCETAAQFNDGRSWTGTITHPSGLVGSFTIAPLVRGRSYVTHQCNGLAPNTSAVYPRVYYQPAIVSKTFSGAGLPGAGQTWSYSYSTPNASWSSDACASSGTCATTVATDVLDPEGHDVHYVFSNRYDATESQLLSTTYHSAGATSSVLRTESSTYASLPLIGDTCPAAGAWPWPWPCSYGGNLQVRFNQAQMGKVSPVIQRTISQDGDTYTWQAEAFDPYAQVTQTKRFNTIANGCLIGGVVKSCTLEEATTYRNDTALWVLGLPLTVTNVGTGEVESSNTYNTSNDTLLTRARFGQTLMNYTFHGTADGAQNAGQLASFTDGNNHTTTLGSYKRGIPQTIGYPDSTSESLTVDDFGQITAITDQAGHTTSYSYDPTGRITSITYPSGDEQAWYPKTFAYSYVTSAERGVPANHWKRTTTTGSATAVTYFDAMLRPVLSDSLISGTVQASTLSTYDSKGQKLFSAYPSATALTFSLSPSVAGSTTTYDALGRATQVAQSSELGTLTSSTAYLSGARQQVTDPKTNVTTTTYQVFDQPSYDAVIQVAAPAGINQSITRDVYGNPLSIRQYGSSGGYSSDLTKKLIYDSYYRLCRTSEPESGSTVMDYDSANNLAWSADGVTVPDPDATCAQGQVTAAAKTTRTYDPMNRVQTLLPPTGTQSTSYSYNALGNLTSTTSGISQWTGTYNYRGMLTSETLQLTGQSAWTLGYSHDAYGSLSTIQYPDGESVSYAPDALGRPTQAGSYASGVSYFPNGQVSGFLFGNGAAYAADQNSRQLLSNFSYGHGSTVDLSEDLVYDKNGNITAVTDLAGSTRNKAFGYDALNRLTSAQAGGLAINETYAYDPLNNLRSRLTGGQTLTYNYDATNKLSNVTNGASTVSSYVYDNRGNVINNNGNNLTFDLKNQLTQIQGFDSYAYDASGRRVMKNPNTATAPVYYMYSQAGQLMYQVDAATQKSTDFIYLGNKLVGDNEGFATHVLGTIDGVTLDGANNASLNGWACSSGMPQSLTVEVFAGGPSGGGGTQIATAAANVASEAAVATACQSTGSAYRFTIALTTAMRSQYPNAAIYMYGDSPVGAGNLVLNHSGTYQVPVYIPNTAPTVTTPAISATGSYTVSWGTVSGATSYTLQERVNGGGWATVQTGSATSQAMSGKSNGSAYGYQVQGCNAGGCGPWSAAATTTVTFPPASPASITVPATSSGSVAVSWAASSTATSYTLQQQLGSGGWSTVYTGAATSSTRTLTTTGSYTYQVQACNAGGCSAYKVSSAVVVTIPPASAPTLTVPATSNTGSYTVSWTAVSAATSYTLQEQVNGGSWATIQTSSAVSKAISGKANGAYGYKVQACNAGGCGPWSSVATTTVTLPPPVPASITVPATSSGSVAVSWAASSTATSYTLQQQLGSGGWSTVYTGAATSSTRTLTITGSYTYQVQACNAGGCSAYKVSSAVVVTIPPASAPTLTVPATSNTGSYTVSWTAVSAATSYTLQEKIGSGSWTTIQTSSATSMARSGKADGSYSYQVEACNAGGCAAWSTAHSVVVTHPPTATSSLTVPASNSSGSYTVSWSAVALATSYTLQEQFNGGSWATIQTSSALSMAPSNKASGTYGYRVQGCNAGGCGPWSTTHSITVLRIPATPSGPTLSVKNGAGAIVTAIWTSSTDAATYTVEDTPAGGSTATFYNGPNTRASGSFEFNGQIAFHVKACNASGCSPWNANAYITVQGDIGLMAQPAESGSVQGGAQ